MHPALFNPIGTPVLLFMLIVLPFLAALCVYSIRQHRLQVIFVTATGMVLMAGALVLISRVPFKISTVSFFRVDMHAIVEAADFLLLGVIFYFGVKHRHALVQILAGLQILLLAYLEFFSLKPHDVAVSLYGDNLALIMVLIASIVGTIICFQAIPYMQAHEAHLGLETSRRPRFFAVMLLFLGGMNGVVLANDLSFFYFFFEVTTLCSFLLIGHDNTPIAVKNSLRALWMNSLGGLLFVLAMILVYNGADSLDMQRLITGAAPHSGIYLPALALLCLAAFTKSAQFPFQSWLLGAMVAPTPVSALLHSSTMVKIGVYLALRMAPAMRGTFLSECLAVFGAFSFLAAAALAVGQSNGKKVLAYSTISNLGLIFACAGLNTPEAFTAGVLLIMFHAIIKALLFLCVGTIEQRIESRDIEDMRGLYARMPVTALITVTGVIMMIMPPFGLLLGKWMAIGSAARNLYVIVMVTTGSALTVMYWARWAGTLMSDPFAGRFTPERQPVLTWGALGALCAGGGIISAAAPWLYLKWFTGLLSPGYSAPYGMHGGILENAAGAFAVGPLAVVAAVGFIVAVIAVRRATRARLIKPYLSGLQTDTPGMFTGPLNRPVKAEASNYYLSSIFGENRLTTWVNMTALVLLTLLIGGTL